MKSRCSNKVNLKHKILKKIEEEIKDTRKEGRTPGWK